MFSWYDKFWYDEFTNLIFLYITVEMPPALSVHYASERGSFEDLSDYEIWEILKYLTLSLDSLDFGEAMGK